MWLKHLAVEFFMTPLWLQSEHNLSRGTANFIMPQLEPLFSHGDNATLFTVPPATFIIRNLYVGRSWATRLEETG